MGISVIQIANSIDIWTNHSLEC